MPTKSANLTVQKWGNSLAIRIPVSLARTAHLQCGSSVDLAIQNGNIVIKLTGELSLEERLSKFDPEIHGGEAMVAPGRIGAEKF
jgi:antitoxin MazE